MAQFARPDGDTTIGNYVDEGGGTTTIYQSIDEVTASSSDYITPGNSPYPSDPGEVYIGTLSNVTDPASSTGHIMRVSHKRSGAGSRNVSGRMLLFQGSTEIARTANFTLGATHTTTSYTLSAAEADAITDYTDLNVRFHLWTSGGSGNPQGRITQAELEVPDASGTTYDETGLSFQTTFTIADTDAAARDETGNTAVALVLTVADTDTAIHDETGAAAVALVLTVAGAETVARDETGNAAVALILTTAGADTTVRDETGGVAAAVLTVGTADSQTMVETGGANSLVFTVTGSDGLAYTETGQTVSLVLTVAGSDSLPINETGLQIVASFTIGETDVSVNDETGRLVPLVITVGGSDTTVMVETGASYQVVFVVGESDVLNPGAAATVRPLLFVGDRLVESDLPAVEGQWQRPRISTS